MPRYARVDDLLIEPLGQAWAAFSPSSGETTLLNDESVAILEVLEAGPADTAGVCRELLGEERPHDPQMEREIESGWPVMLDNGLVRRVGRDMPSM
jgi:hypothetical protein